MRYERVQEILDHEPAFEGRLSPRTVQVETRFGEKLFFSKETVEITETMHREGRDAHKVPKSDVLRAAGRLIRAVAHGGLSSVSGNGSAHESGTPPKNPYELVAPPSPPPPRSEKPASVASDTKLKKKPVGVAKPVLAATPKKAPVKKSEASPSTVKPKPAKPGPALEPELPLSELPPEKQPLSLPPGFDPSKYPHYSVQSSVYSLLLSALAMSEQYEKYPNHEQRQHKLDELVKEYQATCDTLRVVHT
jgi:hypothetical protein